MSNSRSLFETLEDRNLARLREVLAGRHKEWPITVRQIELLRRMEEHRGLARIASTKDLCTALKCDRRSLSDDVQELRMLGVGIGAGRGEEDHGYYLITCDAELQATKVPMVNHALTMLRTAKALDRENFDAVFGQLRLQLFPEDIERAYLEAANG